MAGKSGWKVEALQLDDTIKIPPYRARSLSEVERCWKGRAVGDQSAMTGESQPVAKAKGDRLLAGTRNLDGSLVMRWRRLWATAPSTRS